MDKRDKLTREQNRAIQDLDRRLFIAAGAGSGKTTVVAGRFVEAIARGKAGVDQILTITFTKKAAAEMMDRVRKELRRHMGEDPDPERAGRMRTAYRNIERARISTLDSFYAQILKTNALAAGIDPKYTTADESRSIIMREEAFDACLRDFVARHGARGADFVLAYNGLDGTLFSTINRVYDNFRSRGQKPQLPSPDPEKLFHQSRQRLIAAIDGFDNAIKNTGCQGVNADKIRESNLELLAALKTTDLDEAERRLQAGKPQGGIPKIKPELDELKAAQVTALSAVRSLKAVGTIALMDDLLRSFDETYRDLKQQSGTLDFADLSVFTRDLLVRNEGIRQRLASSFKLIMVDEFQDTNPLQQRITEMIAVDNLMMVGDENQSIFGFRDAEVGLFQEENRRAQSGGYRIRLLDNFRSQRQILDFVDRIFQDRDMLPGYLKLEPKARIDPYEEDSRVEVILVDQQPPEREDNLPADDARLVEARLIAMRLHELFQADYEAGDAAILVKTRTGVEVYRDALEHMGIDSYLGIGISYYERPVLGDVINMFRLLVNPLDDESLIAVLRSPLVAVSDDTLYWLRQAAGPGGGKTARPLWTVVRSGPALKRFPEDELARLRRFARDLKELRLFAGRHALQDTAWRVIFYNDYAATTAAGEKGAQEFANLMKLLDLAADFEAVWGRDLPAFAQFLTYQKSVKAREADAPIVEEGVDAVRILTMHTAKGLEFPLVVIPKLGAKRSGGRSKPVLIVDRRESAGRVGLQYRDTDGVKETVFDYEELFEEQEQRELEEEKRLHYVAMTRAKRHLLLVGCAVADEPASEDPGALPFDWIRSRLALDRANRPGLDRLEVIDDVKGLRVGLKVCHDPDPVLRQEIDAAAHRKDDLLPEPLSEGINKMPAAAIYIPASVSPTSLDTFISCPRRYYFDSVLHARELFESQGMEMSPTPGGKLSAADMGSLVHGILETDVLVLGSGSISPEFLDEQAARVLDPGTTLSPADHELAVRLLEKLARAPVARELIAAAENGSLQRELTFSTLVDRTIISGTIDAICPSGEGTLVVDYKTGSVGKDHDSEEAAKKYKSQIASYALAAARLNPGTVRVVLVFLGGDDPVEFSQEFSQQQAGELERYLRGVISEMANGTFKPLSEPHASHCTWCSGGPSHASICPTGARLKFAK